jgi:XTP/dITP diphosphohydrolase
VAISSREVFRIEVKSPEFRLNFIQIIVQKKYKKPVLVTDTGSFIDALNGFPGANTKFTLNRIGNKGLIKLLEGFENRR